MRSSVFRCLGWGAGAYSRLTSDAFPWGLHLKNIDDLEAYDKAVAATGFGFVEKEAIDQSAAEKDYLVTRLRLLEGLSAVEFEAKFQKNIMISYGKQIKRLRGLGLLDSSQKMLKLTSKGLLYLNAVLVEFM